MAVSRNKPSTDAAAANAAACTAIAAAVAAFLRAHIQAPARVTVAFSGGVDSTVLLHAVRAGCDPECLLDAVHVHHGLSPNADAWAAHCMEAARAMGVPCTVARVRVSEDLGSGLEAAARQARLAALTATGADWILLGHHADDQAETFLLNVLRGAGVRGSGAMRTRQGRLLRPLLGVSRALLHSYAEHHGLRWVNDESNADRRFTRNFLRHEIFPALVSRFPAAVARLGTTSRHMSEAQELLDQLAELDLAGTASEFPLPLALLQRLSPPRAANLLRWMLATTGAMAPNENRLREFVRQLQDAAPDRHPCLEYGPIRLRVAQRQLHFEIRRAADQAP